MDEKGMIEPDDNEATPDPNFTPSPGGVYTGEEPSDTREPVVLWEAAGNDHVFPTRILSTGETQSYEGDEWITYPDPMGDALFKYLKPADQQCPADEPT